MKLLKIYSESFKGLSQESWMLAIVMLINRSGAMVLPFLGVYITDHLHFSLQSAGIILSSFGVGSVVGSWLGGMVTDKIGAFKVQVFSLLLSAPLFCVIPLFKTEIGLASILFVLSVVSEAFRPANSVAVSKYAKGTKLTQAFSLNRMAINLGFSIGPGLGGVLSAISYDFLFYCNAAGALLAGLMCIVFFRNRNYRNPEIKIKVTEKHQEKSPYQDKKFLWFSIAGLAFSVCFFQLMSTLPIFYKDAAKISSQQIGMVLAFSGFLIVLLEMPLVQWAEKKLSLGSTLLWGALCCAISFGMLSVYRDLWWLYLSMSFLCIGEILVLPYMSTATALRSGERNKGAYMGLLGIGTSVAFIITPSLGTWIAQDFGFNYLWLLTTALLLLAAIGFYKITPWMLRQRR